MGNMPYPITELFVWVVDDPSGVNGILGMWRGGMPMQCASSRREAMDSPEMRAIVADAAETLGMQIHLKRFLLTERLACIPEGN